MPENKMSDLTNAPKGATHYNHGTLSFYKYSVNNDKMYYFDGNMWVKLNHWPPSNAVKKIPAKAEQWTIYNNTLPLCELTDEQVGKLVKHSGCVEHMNPNSGEWTATITPMWNRAGVYRIKSKSERELFIDKSVGLMTSETDRTMEQMFGAQFDAGARYKDLTQHFGENI